MSSQSKDKPNAQVEVEMGKTQMISTTHIGIFKPTRGCVCVGVCLCGWVRRARSQHNRLKTEARPQPQHLDWDKSTQTVSPMLGDGHSRALEHTSGKYIRKACWKRRRTQRGLEGRTNLSNPKFVFKIDVRTKRDLNANPLL